MKQLPCALVLALAGLVAGTPHGYGGIKSGAVAKAEAGAVAGSFGGLPISFPAGGAYSGSFSSSKSSASSSASSSAHSSSFSFSGSGAYPELSNGGSPIGCSTGNCQGANELSAENNGFGKNGNSYGLAGSGATAGAVAGSAQLHPDGSPCNGNCASAPNQCTSGKCGAAPYPNKYDSDDIPVNVNEGAKNSYGNSGSASFNKPLQYGPSSPGCTSGNCGYPNQYNTNKASGYGPQSPNCVSGNCGSPNLNAPNQAPAYGPTSPACTSGNCGSPNQYNPKPTDDDGEDDGSYKPEYNPTDYSDDNDNGQYKPSSNCKSGNCNGNGFQHNQAGAGSAANAGAAAAAVTKPIASNVGPTHGPTCTSPGCGSSYGSPNPVKQPKPSSYNVPLYPGRFPPGESGCTSGDCYGNPDNVRSPTNSNHLSPTYVQPASASQPSYAPPKCSTPGCNSVEQSQPQPIESFPNFIPLKEQTGSPNCASGNCGSYPTLHSSSAGAGSHSTAIHPSYSHGPAPGYHTPAAPSGSPGCSTPNCGSYPSPAAPISKPQTLPTVPANNDCGPGGCGSYPTNPNYAASPAEQPVYTGGFGAPSGILKPNDFSAPKPLVTPQQQSASKPYYPTSAPQHFAPTQAHSPQGNVPKPAVHTPDTQANYGYNQAGAGAFAAASANAVSYSGGFGGPPGLLKPYDGGKTSSGPAGVGPKYQAAPSNNALGNGAYGSGSGSGSYGGSQSGAAAGQTGSHFNAPISGAYNPGDSSGGSSGGAVAGAQAGDVAGVYSGGFGFGHNVSSGGKNGAGGCNSGCNGSSGSGYKESLLDGLAHPHGSSAKGLAGGFGLAGSFASSSASAHAGSGALTKGYGRR